MQLIFYYNPNDKSQNHGINFSPEYDFRVEYCADGSGSADKSTYTFNANQEWEVRNDVYADDTIVSLSALVGENGSGKTHILRSILGITPYDDLKDPIEHKKRDQYVFVVKKDNHLYLYHKIEQGSFRIEQNTRSVFFLTHDTSIKSGKEEIRKNVAINGIFEKTSILYFTGSFYEKWATGISSLGAIRTAKMSPAAETTWASTYFETVINHNDNIHSADEDYYWRRYLKDFNVAEGFQRIMDLRFYKKLEEERNQNQDYESIFRRTQDGFKISFATVYGVLNSRSADYLNYKNGKNPWVRDKKIDSKYLSEDVFEEHVFWNGKVIERLYSQLSEEDRFSRYLYYNLLFELCIDKGEEIPDGVSSIDDAVKYIKSEIEDEKNRNNLRTREYYRNALEEIKELVYISESCDRVQNIYDPTDMAYDRSMRFFCGEESYTRFLNLIERSYQSGKTFLLKYLRLIQNDLSTGQRCLQNYASWLILLPEIQHIKGNEIEHLDDNILLLIDEIDLYLHPEWQRKIIYEFINQLKRIFSGSGKRIQIIITTHSPLCLCDVPSENTAYLYHDTEGYHIKERETNAQSFGREIYEIYKNSFFLSNTMGEYASQYVNGILKEIDDLREKVSNGNVFNAPEVEAFTESINSIDERAGIIGHGILKKHIERMLDWIRMDIRNKSSKGSTGGIK